MLGLGQSFVLDPPKFRFEFRPFWHPNLDAISHEILVSIDFDGQFESREFRESLGKFCHLKYLIIIKPRRALRA